MSCSDHDVLWPVVLNSTSACTACISDLLDRRDRVACYRDMITTALRMAGPRLVNVDGDDDHARAVRQLNRAVLELQDIDRKIEGFSKLRDRIRDARAEERLARMDERIARVG